LVDYFSRALDEFQAKIAEIIRIRLKAIQITSFSPFFNDFFVRKILSFDAKVLIPTQLNQTKEKTKTIC